MLPSQFEKIVGEEGEEDEEQEE
jgi:hypothetical protein